MKHSIEMEMSVLGSMILSPKAILSARKILCHGDFFRAAHQFLFTVLCDMSDRGRAVDFVTLKHEIESAGALERCGGEDYLLQIADFVPSAANVEHYAEAVREIAERRERAAMLEQSLKLARDPDASLDELRASMHGLDAIRGSGSPFSSFAEIGMERDRRRGVTTGFSALDAAITTSGYPSGQLTVVSAYHKGRKTSYMLSSMVNQLSAGKRVGFATFADLSKQDLKERMVRNLCGFSREPSIGWRVEGFHEAVKSVNHFAGGIYDASCLETGDDVETFIAWFKAEHSKASFDCFFIDYAQKLMSSDKRAVSDLAQLSMISRKLCKTSARAGIPFVVASQLTEGNVKEGRKAITKGGRVLEEDAGWVLRITDQGNIEIAFSRFGEQSIEVPMVWNKTHLRFEEAAA